MKEVRSEPHTDGCKLKILQYYRDPEATKKALQGGWFHSGDLAVWHPDGYIAVQDRSKDIIISGGEVCSHIVIIP